ncbi:MAG TPA: FHA domain-containing protein [Coleofasciculaceae cyanobacterium]
MRLVIDNSRFQVLSDALSLIGRAKDCQIQILNTRVSRYQCSLIRRYQNSIEYFQIVDGLLSGNPSSNGTFLNGQRLGQIPINLHHGDKITFAGIEIIYELTSGIKFADKDETLPQAVVESV